MTDVKLFGRAVRCHWGVENGLHWHLDVIFKEDDCPARDVNAQKNMNTLRKIVLNTLKKRGPAGIGVKLQRKRAGWSDARFAETAKLFMKI